ncbi:DNA damage-inducible protein 1 [Tulasnella sp. 425]|nr:DNA damage-inducible protein 1 [Tulasnella sp. 425]
MRLTFFTDMGQSYVIEVDPQMELENIMALLEAEAKIPAPEQSISFQGRDLSDPKATLASFGIGDEAMLLLRRKVVVAGRTVEQDSEMMRLQILGDPQLMRQLQQVRSLSGIPVQSLTIPLINYTQAQPELAAAAQNNPRRFAELLGETRRKQQQAEHAKQREIEALNADPFNIEAQRKIEEAIRMEAVMENLEHAMEFSPEAFGRVHMLYIPVEVNGHPVKAFVDSGAQQTIISPECAEACGIMRLLDTRFSGIAKGVGTAKILGRVHSAQIKVADVFLPCSFTVLEGKDVDLLFGLDMLKAHQACIDLEKNVLRIRGREVPFLAEHDLPKNSLGQDTELADTPSHSSAPTPGPSSSQPRFPGAGNTLASNSSPSPGLGSQPTNLLGRAGPQFPEKDIETLMALGMDRNTAVQSLVAAGGNVDLAASLLFQ